MYFAKLKQSLELMLQRNVKFCVNDKVLREGKVILYNLKDFYIEFIIITKKDQRKIYEIPVPFNIIQKPNTILFDYSIPSLCKGDGGSLFAIKILASSIVKKSKLYDNILSIEM